MSDTFLTSPNKCLKSRIFFRTSPSYIIQFFRDGDAILGDVNPIVNELKFGSRQTEFISIEHIKPIMLGFLGHIQKHPFYPLARCVFKRGLYFVRIK